MPFVEEERTKQRTITYLSGDIKVSVSSVNIGWVVKVI